MAAVYKYNSANKISVQIDRDNDFPTKQSDDFCWSCHRDKPTLFCTSCVRSYHGAQFCSGSRKMSAEAKRSWKCPVCNDIQTDVQLMHTKQINAKDVSKMLSLVLERIKCDENFSDVLLDIDYSKVSPKVVHPMDLCTIEQNVDDFIYRCYEEFLSDIKWIVHNVKACSQFVFRSEAKAAKAIKWLLDTTKEEIYSIRMCHECYIGMVQNNRFDVVCKQPHLIVWAKQRGYPYWPAKLMSVNVAKNIVEVRYFGEKHFRAILAPKDCYMYSAEQPSIHLGTRKKAFEQALVEVKSYIKRVSEVYGTFNVAAANTPLIANKLERHLYDAIPKAWIALGKSTTPSPMKTVVTAAASRISRRHSVASRSVIASPQPTPPILPSSNDAGRITARRMSSRISQMNVYDNVHSEIDGAKKSQKVFARRQSVQVDMVNSGKRNFWNDTDLYGERISALSSASRKRKSNDDDGDAALNTVNNKTKQTTSKSANDSTFKMPEIPRKIRKVAPEMSSNGTVDAPSPNQNSTESNCPPVANETPNTELNGLFDTFIYENTPKLTDCARTIVNGILHEFWNSAQPLQSQLHTLQTQLNTMQSDYTRQIDELRRERSSLKQKLNTLTGKYEVQSVKVREAMQKNAELNGIQNETDLKLTALTMDLKKMIESNTELTNDLNQMRIQNGDCQLTIEKLEAERVAAIKLLLDAESKGARLDVENKRLTEKNSGLDLSLQCARKNHQNTLERLREVERKCNLEKSEAFEHCYRIISDNKGKQWCSVCQESGGRYYCSSKCEEKYWRQNRS